LLLAGCGNDNGTSSTFNVSGLPQPSPIDPGVSLQASNFFTATSTMLNMVATDGGGPGLVGNVTGADARQPLAVAANLQAAYGALIRGGTNTIPGPGGGSATATVNGTSASLALNNFAGPNGLVNGNVAFTGAPSATGFTSSANLTGLQVVPPNGRAYRLDGPVNMAVNATGPSSFVTVFGSNMTVSDANGSTARYLNFITITNISSQVANQANGSQTQSGSLLFAQFRGLTGAVNVSTPQVLRVANSIFEGGQWLFQGSGQTRATGLGSNSVLIEGAPVGGVFAPVQTVDLATILQAP